MRWADLHDEISQADPHLNSPAPRCLCVWNGMEPSHGFGDIGQTICGGGGISKSVNHDQMFVQHWEGCGECPQLIPANPDQNTDR